MRQRRKVKQLKVLTHEGYQPYIFGWESKDYLSHYDSHLCFTMSYHSNSKS